MNHNKDVHSSSSKEDKPVHKSLDLSKPEYFYKQKKSISDSSLPVSISQSSDLLMPDSPSNDGRKSVDIAELPEKHIKEQKELIEGYEKSFDNLVAMYKDKRENDHALKHITDQRKKAKGDYNDANYKFQQSFIKLDQFYRKQVAIITDNLQTSHDALEENLKNLQASRDAKNGEIQGFAQEKTKLTNELNKLVQDVIPGKETELQNLLSQKDSILQEQEANKKLLELQSSLTKHLASDKIANMYVEIDFSKNIETIKTYMQTLEDGQEILQAKDNSYQGFDKEKIQEAYDNLKGLKGKKERIDKALTSASEINLTEEYKKELWDIKDTIQTKREEEVKSAIEELDDMKKKCQGLITSNGISKSNFKNPLKEFNKSVKALETSISQAKSQRGNIQDSLFETNTQRIAVQDSLSETNTQILAVQDSLSKTNTQILGIQKISNECSQKYDQAINRSNINPNGHFFDYIEESKINFKEVIKALDPFIRGDEGKDFEQAKRSFEEEYKKYNQHMTDAGLKHDRYKNKRSEAIKRKATILLEMSQDFPEQEQVRNFLDHLKEKKEAE